MHKNPVAKLVVVTGTLSGEAFPLEDQEVTIGRDPANTICVPDRSLSRRHCVLVRTTTGWEVRDLGSVNGTSVNNVPVSVHQLRDGDRLAIGGSLVLFQAGAAPVAAELRPSAPIVPTRELAPDATRYLGLSPQPASVVEQGLRTLLAVSTAIGAAASEEELHRELLVLVRNCTAAAAAAILLRDADGLTIAASSRPGRGVLAINETLARRVIAERVAVVTRGEGDDSWLLCAPLAAGATVLGALYLARGDAAGAFSDDDLQLVTAVGRVAAIPLESVRRTAAAQRDIERLRADLGLNHNMVGGSPPMRAVYERITRVAASEATVLVTGETGTGKELVARAIHENSPRARGPFVAINCAALTETLLESELFGYERGAFTGAVAQKKGKLETAAGGTLFLDEVGEMGAALQSKLLRVLQERQFDRVGGTRPIRLDVRLISATNRSLPEEVAAGRFRQDLYFRLNVVSVQMPALRERQGDVPILARHFLERYAGGAGRRVTGLAPETLSRLIAYPWPGNVRELENAIHRAVVLGSTEDIVPDDLPEEVLQRPSAATSHATDLDFHAAVVRTKKQVIVAAFERAGRSYVEAARLLHVHPNYLHRLIRNLDLKGELESNP